MNENNRKIALQSLTDAIFINLRQMPSENKEEEDLMTEQELLRTPNSYRNNKNDPLQNILVHVWQLISEFGVGTVAGPKNVEQLKNNIFSSMEEAEQTFMPRFKVQAIKEQKVSLKSEVSVSELFRSVDGVCRAGFGVFKFQNNLITNERWFSSTDYPG